MSDSPAPPDNRTDRLGTERVGKLLLEFSIPAIVSMVFNTLYNVVDTIFLGQALPDGSGVAVTTLAFPVMTLLMGFSMIAGQGGNALAAIQLGKGEKDQVERTLGNSATLLVGIAVVIAVMSGLLIDPILAGIGTTDELWDLTKTFVQIICFGFIFQSLGMGLNNFLRTAGRPNLALGTMIFGTAMCIIFNYLFVIVLGFGVSGDLENFAVYALRVYVIFFAPVGFQIVGSSYFQSSGQPMKAAILELTRQVLFLIPLYLLLPPALTALFGTTGLEGVIISAPVSDALSVCVTSVFVAREVRKLRRLRDSGGIA